LSQYATSIWCRARVGWPSAKRRIAQSRQSAQSVGSAWTARANAWSDAARRRGRRSGDAVRHARCLRVVARAREIAGVLEVRSLPLCDDQVDAGHQAARSHGNGR
jgi:hypothetical protein